MPIENIGDINLWERLLAQTPSPIRYALGVMALGLASLAAAVWRRKAKDLDELKDRLDKAEDERKADNKDLHERIDRSDREVTHRLDEVNAHLIQIARNTNQGPGK